MNKVGELLACHVEVTNDEVLRFFEEFSRFYFKKDVMAKGPDASITLVIPETALVDFPNLRGRRMFHGTFNLEEAKHKEELEFFALGHPLLTDALNYCKRPEFGGVCSSLRISRQSIPVNTNLTRSALGTLWFFYLEFTGVIVEREIRPVYVDGESNGDLALGESLFQKLRQDPRAFKPSSNGALTNMDLKRFLEQTETRAKQLIAQYITTRVPELEKTNTNAFQLEKRKYERLKEYTHDNLVKDIERAKLERQAAYTRNPTDKQIREAEAMPNTLEKEKKMADIQARQRRIEHAVQRVKDLELVFEKKEFDYGDELRRLSVYRHLQVKIEIYTASFIEIED